MSDRRVQDFRTSPSAAPSVVHRRSPENCEVSEATYEELKTLIAALGFRHGHGHESLIPRRTAVGVQVAA